MSIPVGLEWLTRGLEECVVHLLQRVQYLLRVPLGVVLGVGPFVKLNGAGPVDMVVEMVVEMRAEKGPCRCRCRWPDVRGNITLIVSYREEFGSSIIARLKGAACWRPAFNTPD
jgi:hypothetical protein